MKGTLYNTNTKSLPRGSAAHGCDEKTRLSYSSSSSSHREHQQQQQQPQQQQQQHQAQTTSNYSTNTLPKNHHQQQPASQQIYGKVTNPSRSSVLNDVVNKVPSVIMLPLPSQSQQSSNNNQIKGISMLKTSSRDNLCDSSDDRIVVREVGSACHSQNSTLKRSKSKKETVNANEKVISSKSSSSLSNHEKLTGSCSNSSSSSVIAVMTSSSSMGKCVEKPLPVLTTTTNCTNPKEHFLPNETSLDDDYLSECENCKTAGTGSRYYLDDEEIDEPLQETMTLQRKLMNENDENDQQSYYRVSSTLPTNTNKKTP